MRKKSTVLNFTTAEFAFALTLTLTVSATQAQEHSAERIDGPPEAGEISDELSGQLADHGVRVKRGGSRTVCEIWLTQEWTVDPDVKTSQERLYPFSPGQLIGVLHFSRRGSEFRDQTVKRGWYTLRYGLQPVDGNHVGTSPTRDFLILIDAKDDAPDKTWELEELMTASAEVAGSNHPAMLCLQKPTEGSDTALRHDEEHDWWILHVSGTGGESTEIPIDLIVAGHAAE